MLHYFKFAEIPPALTVRRYFTQVAPLGVIFSLYLFGTNEAYEQGLGVALIQIIKPMSGPLIFLLSSTLGLERQDTLANWAVMRLDRGLSCSLRLGKVVRIPNLPSAWITPPPTLHTLEAVRH